MAIKAGKHFNTVLLCLSIVLGFLNTGIAQQPSKKSSMKTAASEALKTTATISDLETNVSIDEFHKQVPALREMDYRIVGMSFMPVSGKDSSAAKEIHFENSEGESGIIRLFTKKYIQMQTSFDLEVYRIQIDSNKRYVLWTVAVQPIGGADNLAVMFNEMDRIDPIHGDWNRATSGGCFDASITHCPSNSAGSNLSGTGVIHDPSWDRCFREVAYEISKCVAWEGFNDSCASGIASAIGARCP